MIGLRIGGTARGRLKVDTTVVHERPIAKKDQEGLDELAIAQQCEYATGIKLCANEMVVVEVEQPNSPKG